MTAERQTCPDDGTCHHSCEPGECYRVRYCGPLLGVFPGDRWPVEVVHEHGGDVRPGQVISLTGSADVSDPRIERSIGDEYGRVPHFVVNAAAWHAGDTTGVLYVPDGKAWAARAFHSPEEAIAHLVRKFGPVA